MNTVFITGASSGIGRDTAKVFAQNGWNVIATMRSPERETELCQIGNVKVLRCDVTDTDSIRQSISDGLKAFDKIDVLVNNAGYDTIGVLEAASDEHIRREIETNLLGLIQTTKEMLPYFREQKQGTIINLSSIAGRTTVPLQTLYHATKWGVEGFSESLQYEVRPFNIKVRLIEPGVIKTDFYGRSMTVVESNHLKDYQAYSKKVIANLLQNGNNGSNPKEVAALIYKVANSNSHRMRYAVGKSKSMITLKKLLPENVFFHLVNSAMSK